MTVTAKQAILLTKLVVLCLAGVGWVMNIVKIFYLFNADVSAEIIIRLFGIPIVPLGAIAGYF